MIELFSFSVVTIILLHAVAFFQLVTYPCVDAFQPVVFAPRNEYHNFGRGSLFDSCSGVGSRIWCVPAGRQHGNTNTNARLEMASPLIQEDGDGDATTTDVDDEKSSKATDEDAPTLASIPDDKVQSYASTSTSGITATTASSRQLPNNWLGEKTYILFTAILIGLFTGTNIAVFKTVVEFVREVLYRDGLKLPLLSQMLSNSGGEEILTFSLRLSEDLPRSAIPVVGGLIVGILLRFGGDMPPGLRDTVKEVDLDSIRASNATPPLELISCTNNIPPPSERNDFLRFFRKALAATATLGTGNSLGPEGPSVEAGMGLSRLLINNEFFSKISWVFGTLEDYDMSEVERVNRKMARDRLLLACGAAAGVSAGFNAPLSGVFFALEIVQNAFVTIDFPVKKEKSEADFGDGDEMQIMTTVAVGGEPLALQQINISAILLASVVSALTIQLLLGSELALRLGEFDFKNPLLELPLYLVLGAMSGITAAIFSGVAQFFKNVVDGEEGPAVVQEIFQSMPKYLKPLIGSIVCGIVGIYVPQVLFFGYETLNGLFLNDGISTVNLFILLVAKLLTTAICASCGLVGGTFAPSLFLGGVLGAGFHNVISDSLQSISHANPDLSAYPIFQGISGLPAFAMVGAASVLAALFRAPLTASLLLFECTRNYDVILPLMASAGVASLTGDIVEKWLDEEQRENDPVSWGDLATRIDEETDDEICIPPLDRGSMK
mmetsp:Transcript_3088/g.6790  ORF Transcript_3088/g.6790 Transcript_3088/m.6790 type:complete len:722 (-) Transcript_3088:125-2290(-)|eukprot:CAMPEP_0172297796 /NCGR_PEP_ID=MMETSP1058-20130122/690_1 /TAXON_ID=83371 /ORGANISM="Detonula confervacea, Strain CCMP 353" /LENGTH=721 /DNA_ID=CAMNT_0013006987 /DNA_START=97 /DNA_END=2262 /DNA_ORIENTATION=-